MVWAGERPRTWREHLELYVTDPRFAAWNLGVLAPESPGGSRLLQKADDPLSSSKTDWFDPAYTAKVETWYPRYENTWRLLPKTSYLALGDSYKYVTSRSPLTTNFHGWMEATDLSSEDTDVVSITDMDKVYPAVMGMHWKRTFHADLISKWQTQPPMKGDPKLDERLNTDDFVHQINSWLVKQLDTPCTDGTDFYIESLDRVISSKAESTTTYVSAASDGDLQFGENGKTIDRSSATTWDAQVDLPGSAAAQTLDLGDIDDIMTSCKQYSRGRRFIGLTNDTILNGIQAIIDPQVRYGLDKEVQYEMTLNGVKTREGLEARPSVGALITSGITLPVFVDPAIPTTSSKVTDSEGHFYIIDLDAIEIRMALPATRISTGRDFFARGKLHYDELLLNACQLVPTGFYSHGAVKYLKVA